MEFNTTHKDNKESYTDKAGCADAADTYLYYSKVLNEPFESVTELKEAEEAYYAKLKVKADKALQKKDDAKKVEDAFKNLNAARRTYKENIISLTTQYGENLNKLKADFEADKVSLQDRLAKAEETYKKALKEFNDKYDSFHLTLKDGDFETTISSSHTKLNNDKIEADRKAISDIFNLLFSF